MRAVGKPPSAQGRGVRGLSDFGRPGTLLTVQQAGIVRMAMNGGRNENGEHRISLIGFTSAGTAASHAVLYLKNPSFYPSSLFVLRANGVSCFCVVFILYHHYSTISFLYLCFFFRLIVLAFSLSRLWRRTILSCSFLSSPPRKAAALPRQIKTH